MEFGDFELLERLASGPMSEVWLARHRPSASSVALKFVAGSRLGRDEYVRAFLAEARAHAGLQHPSIVTLVDFGVADFEGTRRSFLAMELANGTLRDIRISTWGGLREAISQVLDALSYAHSRGVVHRDLKPGNVLMVDGRLKLADFGLSYSARSIEEGSNPDVRAGTPLYMSPEQVRGEWRTYGPWTDLYALGLMVWELACGRPPFQGRNYIETAGMQLDSPLPPFEAIFDVPEELEAWIHMLTAKNPFARLRGAADALWSLGQVSGRVRIATGVAENAQTLLDTQTLLDMPPVIGGVGRKAEVRPSIDPPPMAPSWPSPKHVSVDPIGLGLFALRPLPPGGHDEVRAQLWHTLRQVVDGHGIQMTWLRDGESCDGAAIADWLAETVVQTGVAVPIVLRHTLGRGARDGFAGFFERAFGTWGLTGQELRSHLEALARMSGPLRQSDVDVVMSELDGAGTSRITGIERFRVLVSLLTRLCLERPVLVVMQDAQWALDELFLIEVLNSSFPHLPIYMVGVVAERLVEDASLESGALQRLMKEPRSTTVDVCPLTPPMHRERVARMLPLSDDLLTEVVARTMPDTSYAAMTLARLARTGGLVSSRTGYQLAEAARLPDSFEDLVRLQLEWAFQDISDEDAARAHMALEVAATLGLSSQRDELRIAWAYADVDLNLELATRLSDAGVIAEGATTWSFRHHGAVEYLITCAREEGRDARWHRACALALAEGSVPSGTARAYRAIRMGEHALRGGVAEVAVQPLHDAVSTIARGNPSLARRLLELRSRLVDALELEPLALERLEQRLDEAGASAALGKSDEAIGLFSSLIEDARRVRVQSIEGIANLHLARLLSEAGEVASSNEHFENALECFGDDAAARARVLVHFAWALHRQGRLAESEGRYRMALDELGPESPARIDALTFLAVSEVAQDRLDDARDTVRRALELLRQTRDLTMIPELLNTLSEIERFSGNWEEARRMNESATWWRSLTPHRFHHVYDFNRALLALGTRRLGQARALLEPLYDGYASHGMASRIPLLDAADAACSLGWGAVEEFDEKMGRLELVAAHHRDIAWCMDIAADLATRSGDQARAERARRLAVRHYEGLGLDHRISAD